MASLTGLISGDFTDIDVLDYIALNGDKGTNGQVISSDGTTTNWSDPHDLLDLEDLTSGTGIAYTSGSTYDGSVARTITTYNVPNSALANSTISGVSLGSNLANLTKGTNITFSSGTTYNGSSAITISSTFTDTTYSAGDGLDLTGTTFSADLKASSGLVITSGEIDLEDIPNANLENATITIGSTTISLGGTSTSVAGLNLLSETNKIIPPNVFVVSGAYHMPFNAGIFHPNSDDTDANYAIMGAGAKTLGRGVIMDTGLEVNGLIDIPNGWSATGSFLDVRDSSGNVITSSPPTYDTYRVFTYAFDPNTGSPTAIPSAQQLNYYGDPINTSNSFYGGATLAGAAGECLMIDLTMTSLTHYIGGGYIILTAPS